MSGVCFFAGCFEQGFEGCQGLYTMPCAVFVLSAWGADFYEWVTMGYMFFAVELLLGRASTSAARPWRSFAALQASSRT